MYNIKKNDFPSLILFALSPILSIPIVIRGLRENSKVSLILICAFFGLLCGLYLPSINEDKSRHIDFYEKCLQINSFNSFLVEVLLKETDFIFYLILYICAKLKISYFLPFTLIGFFTYYSFLKFTTAYFSQLQLVKHLGIWLLIIILILPIIDVFSGVRFMFGAAFIIRAIDSLFFKKKKLQFIIYLILGCVTHFSLIIFLPVFIFF